MKVEPAKSKYHVLLFINGSQVGDDHTFADWYEDDAEAMADAREYFTGEGYAVDSLQIEERVIWPALPSSTGKVLTVRLTTPATPA